ncbi:ABC transporter permease [Rhizobium sp. C4]|uniref:ABC transporter permease n=1 Tax=Rhizobium sp. C4 TaxID=1349800 RepID=UPI001E5EB07E|nr:ABC transporter permease [Rhizobium sp. C4]MCD2171573.1 ABC transporter permease [Rhizobium sp. C4]
MSHVDTLLPPQPAPPAVAQPITGTRLVGMGFVLLWVLLLGGMALMMFNNWDWEKFAKYGPRYISGLQVTLGLVAVSIIGGAIISFPLAFARMSKSRILSGIAYVYVYLFRGTPLLAQVFLIYYGLGSFRPQLESVGLWWFFKDAWNCAVFAFALNTAAYQAEILRGAIESVPRGQREAAISLGINKRISFWKIIMPQALIVALRPYGNEIILMVKASAIVAIVTVYDLMGETKYAFSRTFDYQTYLWAAIFYLVIVEILRNLWNVLEARLTRHLKR